MSWAGDEMLGGSLCLDSRGKEQSISFLQCLRFSLSEFKKKTGMTATWGGQPSSPDFSFDIGDASNSRRINCSYLE